MSIVWPKDDGVIYFDDETPGPQGVEGWYSDSIVKGRTIFWFNGTWWKKDTKLLFWGFKDIAIDGDFWPTKPSWNKDIAFHKGFLCYADKGWNMLKDKLLQCERPIIAGHSLGAAIAQIVALHFVLETGRDVTCIIGGSPGAWGSRSARKLFQEKVPNCVSVQNGWDVVVNTKYLGFIVGLVPACDYCKVPHTEIKVSGGFLNALKILFLTPAYDHTIDKYDAILEPIIRGISEE